MVNKIRTKIAASIRISTPNAKRPRGTGDDRLGRPTGYISIRAASQCSIRFDGGGRRCLLLQFAQYRALTGSQSGSPWYTPGKARLFSACWSSASARRRCSYCRFGHIGLVSFSRSHGKAALAQATQEAMVLRERAERSKSHDGEFEAGDVIAKIIARRSRACRPPMSLARNVDALELGWPSRAQRDRDPIVIFPSVGFDRTLRPTRSRPTYWP
ncbi:hypothetical protein FHX09_005846 [Rhizobium sp. BK538]|nr:hypothetical protein [Rhizobium sp. BK538]TCM63362.1 hypothetical protein EV291_14920 [Rhizobium sp. BK068]